MSAEPLFIFDLDNTLYPPEVLLWRIVDGRIERYVQERLGVDPAEARIVRKGYLREFGTTLRGLMHHHDVEPGEYLEYVHDVPIPEIVPPRPELAAMLSALPGRRVVFTNGSESYARRVLSALGVSDAMEEIYGIEFMEYRAKPSPYPYAKLLRTTGASAPNSLLCEDVRENLVPARELGIFTVLVGRMEDGGGDGRPRDLSRVAHAVLEDVCELPAVLPRFLSRENRGPAFGCAAGKGSGGGRRADGGER
ncbi:MAG: pyrimidine 5'-nucleotidase [Deltaproteobacteria bacterium GWC2_65_14]|nr:MAG: pyrimidine 5'-nucleotidase [Deltaproteobacteria bacterium GWC2_65_14]